MKNETPDNPETITNIKNDSLAIIKQNEELYTKPDLFETPPVTGGSILGINNEDVIEYKERELDSFLSDDDSEDTSSRPKANRSSDAEITDNDLNEEDTDYEQRYRASEGLQ